MMAMRTGFSRRRAMFNLACSAAVLASAAHADTVALNKGRPALENCRIQIISGGGVFVQDHDGKLHEFPLGDVKSLEFDGAKSLSDAEPLLESRQYNDAIVLLLRAAVDAKTNAQRIWALSRLSIAHAGADQYVEATAHAASVFVLDDSGYWKLLEPAAPAPQALDRATYLAAAEAMDRLQRAASAVTSPDLRAAVDRMTVTVQPVYRKLAEGHTGEPFRPNATLSGIPLAVIRGEQPPLETPQSTQPDPKPSSEQKNQSPPAATTPIRASPSTVTPESIDSMLDTGEFTNALLTCQAAAKNPGERDFARFLHQYGRALRGANESPADAAVMFARCAVLFAGSPHADQCLIELANIYTAHYNKAQVARRLLTRAVESAEARGDTSLAETARLALADLDHHASDESP